MKNLEAYGVVARLCERSRQIKEMVAHGDLPSSALDTDKVTRIDNAALNHPDGKATSFPWFQLLTFLRTGIWPKLDGTPAESTSAAQGRSRASTVLKNAGFNPAQFGIIDNRGASKGDASAERALRDVVPVSEAELLREQIRKELEDEMSVNENTDIDESGDDVGDNI